MSILSYMFATIRTVFSGFASPQRYELLFAMSDAELAMRGLNRDKLVRGYIAGFTYG